MHEAAHATLAGLLGRHVYWIWLDADDGGGETHIELRGDLTAAICYLVPGTSQADTGEARRICRHLGIDPSVPALIAAALLGAHSAFVADFAAQIERAGYLAGEDLDDTWNRASAGQWHMWAAEHVPAVVLVSPDPLRPAARRWPPGGIAYGMSPEGAPPRGRA